MYSLPMSRHASGWCDGGNTEVATPSVATRAAKDPHTTDRKISRIDCDTGCGSSPQLVAINISSPSAASHATGQLRKSTVSHAPLGSILHQIRL